MNPVNTKRRLRANSGTPALPESPNTPAPGVTTGSTTTTRARVAVSQPHKARVRTPAVFNQNGVRSTPAPPMQNRPNNGGNGGYLGPPIPAPVPGNGGNGGFVGPPIPVPGVLPPGNGGNNGGGLGDPSQTHGQVQPWQLQPYNNQNAIGNQEHWAKLGWQYHPQRGWHYTGNDPQNYVGDQRFMPRGHNGQGDWGNTNLIGPPSGPPVDNTNLIGPPGHSGNYVPPPPGSGSQNVPVPGAIQGSNGGPPGTGNPPPGGDPNGPPAYNNPPVIQPSPGSGPPGPGVAPGGDPNGPPAWNNQPTIQPSQGGTPYPQPMPQGDPNGPPVWNPNQQQLGLAQQAPQQQMGLNGSPNQGNYGNGTQGNLGRGDGNNGGNQGGQGQGGNPGHGRGNGNGGGPSTDPGGIQQALDQLPMDPQFEATRRILEDNLQRSLQQSQAGTTQTQADAALQRARLGTNLGVDQQRLLESMAGRGTMNSSIYGDNLGLMATDYGRQNQDLASSIGQALTGYSNQAGDAYSNYNNGLMEALLASANRSANDPYAPTPHVLNGNGGGGKKRKRGK